MNRQPQRAHPLELPAILELIGAYLDDDYNHIPTLKACSLVNHEWHCHFAPFLWWRVIDDFDRVLLRLHKIKFAPTLPYVDPNARLEPEFLALVGNFVAKVDDPTIPMAIHRERRTSIKTSSLMSFIILGYLCKPTRAIDFNFHIPPRFQIYDASVGQLVASENVRMSEEYWNTEQRIESILTVLESSPLLEILRLCDSATYPRDIPHQWRQLALPLPAAARWSLTKSAELTNEPPRWPKLHTATFEKTKVDRHYLEIFLHNAPRLRTLHLNRIKIITIQGNTIKRNILPVPATLAQRNQDLYSPDDSKYPYAGIEELFMLALRGISPQQQLEFALGLPDLTSFTFTLDPEVTFLYLPYKLGFARLVSLTLRGNFNHEVLIRATSRLEYLHLTNTSFVDDHLFKTICQHSDTLETVFIHSSTAILDDGPGPHRILRACHRLLKFTLQLPRFNCDPEMFRDQPWVCTNLQSFLVVPDCDTTSSTYTPLQAQAAFFEKIASTLTELTSLSFGGGTGSFGFKPHEGLNLLTPLKELEVLNLKARSFETNAELTVEHAKLVVSEWPKLRAVEGLYHYVCREFINYTQQHRPEHRRKVMSTEPPPPPTTTAAETAQEDRDQNQDADISMASASSPIITRPESQDTIASQQPPSQRQDDEEVEDEVQVLKSEEQDESRGDVKEEEDSVVGGGEMEGIAVNENAGGADEQQSEQEGHQQTTVSATPTGVTKRAKVAGSKSKKPATTITRTEVDQEGEKEEAEEDDDEEEEEDRKPITAKSEHTAEEDDELPLSSDDDDDGDEDNEDEEGGTGSGQHPNDDEYSNLPEETLCRWKDCGKVLPSLAALVIHLSDEHIGWKKTAYTCEWQGCARRPIAQTTRFALISHMRSHTKHKPYDCPVPECDKSFSRSDAMAKHLKFQHGDVPERFTGRKSRGRYTMKDPAASSTLLHSSSFGAKKRRHPDSSRSETDLPSSSSKHRPTNLRKFGANGGGGEDYDEDGYHIGDQQYSDGNSEHRHYHHRSHSDRVILQHLENARRGKRGGTTTTAAAAAAGGGHKKERVPTNNENDDDNDDDASGDDDSDFEIDNGQTPRQRYGLLKAKYDYIHNEREALEAEYEDHKKKLQRLRVERELLLDALLVSQEDFQDPALQAIEDSD
ncbi:hypothetical protein BGZ47_000242 [Haplosporangium gracile]|nr:hypothetical protein BGZ47_000242 [Haplosporangium gracile]